MRYLIILIYTIGFAFSIKAQNPDRLYISFPKEVSNVADCVVKIQIFRKDSSVFIFPKNIRFGEVSDLKADLIFVLEKKSNGKYGQYECSIPMGEDMGWEGNPIEYDKKNTIHVVDSLISLHCLSGGLYRMKLKYNLRSPDGTIQLPNYLLESEWVYFKVNRKMLYLSRRWLKYNE